MTRTKPATQRGKLAIPREVRSWVRWVGRRSDDPELRERLKQVGASRLPRAIALEIPVDVVRPALGLGFSFSPFLAHERFPPTPTRGGFVPYLSSIQFQREVWPAGLPKQGTLAELKRALGHPDVDRGWGQSWSVPIDERRVVGLRVERDDLDSVFWSLGVLGDLYLWLPNADEQRPLAGLTCAWLLERGLLRAKPLASHKGVVESVRRRAAPPGALLDAYPLGWWTAHLAQVPGLREAVSSWMSGLALDPLLELLGEVTDPESPRFRQPALVDDWATADAARPALEHHFRHCKARAGRG